MKAHLHLQLKWDYIGAGDDAPNSNHHWFWPLQSSLCSVLVFAHPFLVSPFFPFYSQHSLVPPSFFPLLYDCSRSPRSFMLPGACSAMHALPDSPDIIGSKVELHHGTDEEADAPVRKSSHNCKGGDAYLDLHLCDYHNLCCFHDTPWPYLCQGIRSFWGALRC